MYGTLDRRFRVAGRWFLGVLRDLEQLVEDDGRPCRRS